MSVSVRSGTLKISALFGMVGARGWRERGMGSYCLMVTEFQFGKMTKVLGMDGDDGCKTV